MQCPNHLRGKDGRTSWIRVLGQREYIVSGTVQVYLGRPPPGVQYGASFPAQILILITKRIKVDLEVLRDAECNGRDAGKPFSTVRGASVMVKLR